MVREASRRKQKFEAKVDPDVLRRQTTALKPLMVKGETEYFPQITDLEERIKKLIEAKGVKTLEVRDYLNYGRELLALSKKFSGVTLQAEAQLKTDKWSTRGLDGLILLEVAELCGITPTVTETINCLFDFLREGSVVVSLLSTTNTFTYGPLDQDTLRATAFPLTRKCQFESFVFYSYTSVAGGELRVGIYDSLAKTRFPNKLISPEIFIPCNFSGTREFPLEITLEKGLYYIATLCNSVAIRTARTTTMLKVLGALPEEGTLIQGLGGWWAFYEYGALPPQFPEEGVPESLIYYLGLRLKRLL